jgi:hypothetical protein
MNSPALPLPLARKRLAEAKKDLESVRLELIDEQVAKAAVDEDCKYGLFSNNVLQATLRIMNEDSAPPEYIKRARADLKTARVALADDRSLREYCHRKVANAMSAVKFSNQMVTEARADLARAKAEAGSDSAAE